MMSWRETAYSHDDRLQASRILQVSSHYPPQDTGGAERVCRSLSHALNRAGHDVSVLAPVPAFEDGAVSSMHYPRPRRRVSPASSSLITFDRPRRARSNAQSMIYVPDVVHVHNVYGVGSQLIAIAARRVPTVVTLHDYWPIDVCAPRLEEGALRYPLRARAYAPWAALHFRRHAAALRHATLVAPSRFLANRIGERIGRTIAVIPNAVDPSLTETTREPRILFVGRMAPEKGLEGPVSCSGGNRPRAWLDGDLVGDGPSRSACQQAFRSLNWHGIIDPASLYGRASIPSSRPSGPRTHRSSCSRVWPMVWPSWRPLLVASRR